MFTRIDAVSGFYIEKNFLQLCKYLLIALLTLFIVSCAPDPRKEAAAFATTSEAEQRAADAEQARRQSEEVHALEMQNREAAQAKWQALLNRVIGTVTIAAQVSAFLLVLSVGVAGVFVMKSSVQAYSKYAMRRAEVMAEIIKIDPVTHTFPVFMVDTGNNVKALMNPNDNSVTLFDVNNPADRAKVQAMANVLYAGQLARHARMSHKPGEVAKINAPQIIESE
jgi:hypothetical protein